MGEEVAHRGAAAGGTEDEREGRCTNGAAAPTARPKAASSQLRLPLPLPPQSGRLRCLENRVAGWVVGVAALILMMAL